jgi:hypothetical protein
MPSPFPGMDPYIEDPVRWSGFHHTFLTAIQERLARALRPKYFVRVEERVYVAQEDDPAYRFIVPDVRVIHASRKARRAPAPDSGGLAIEEPIPVADVLEKEVHEYRLEVRDVVDRAVVTVMELLSPTNKVAGSAGRASFLQKRHEVVASDAHWIEIDLLRDGVRTANRAEAADSEYQIYLNRADSPRAAFVWPIPLQKPLPIIGIPLRRDPDVALNLQDAFNATYETGGYDLEVDYRKPPPTPLMPDRAQWAQQRIEAFSREDSQSQDRLE